VGQVITADEIRLWKDLPMVEYEAAVWDRLGRHYCPQKDRRMVLFYSIGFCLYFHVCVSEGNFTRS